MRASERAIEQAHSMTDESSRQLNRFEFYSNNYA
jgi:hypothetical protein